MLSSGPYHMAEALGVYGLGLGAEGFEGFKPRLPRITCERPLAAWPDWLAAGRAGWMTAKLVGL